MSTKVYFINSPDAEYSDEEFAWFQSLFLGEGVIGDALGVMGLGVTANGTPDMSVFVAAGKALVEVTIDSRTFKVVAENTAPVQISISPNALGTNRVDAVIVRVSKSTIPNALKNNVVTFEVVTGNGVSALADAAIDTAVGGDGWYRLANVTVANADTSITTGEIASTRSRVTASAAFDFANAVPVGVMSAYGGSAAPAGYLMCNGAAVSRTTYANLFGVIGTDFGIGDGSTTFNVPDRRGRMGVGIDTTKKSVVEDCEDAWDEFTASNVTSSADTGDKKVGSASAKFVIGGAVGGNTILATEVISTLDIRNRTHIHYWIKSSVTTAAGDLQILLDDTANCASPIYTLDVPALVANVWKRVTTVLVHPSEPTKGVTTQALVSIGVKMVTDLGAFSLWVDDVATGNAFEMGLATGEEDHTLKISGTPIHDHDTNAELETGSSGSGGTSGGQTPVGTIYPTGGGQSHNNMPPNLASNYIIKY